jgi:hypothetical protein
VVDVWRYPPNWPAISRRIRERDGLRCRWCGAGEGLFDLGTGQPVLLTAMHLDGDPCLPPRGILYAPHAPQDTPAQPEQTQERRKSPRLRPVSWRFQHRCPLCSATPYKDPNLFRGMNSPDSTRHRRSRTMRL